MNFCVFYPVFTIKKNAVKNQNRSRYYYQTWGKYRRWTFDVQLM